MRDAVIVSTARTPIGKAYRGAYNNTLGPTLGSFSVKAAVERAGIEGGEVDDCIIGCALQQGTTGGNVARQIALRAGLPVQVSGMTVDRQCSSGLMAIATAAKQVIHDRMDVVVGGGLESISLVQTKEMRVKPDPELIAMHNAIYMPMIQTAEIVAERYGISREAMDEYALESQRRTAAGQENGKFDDEIVETTTTKLNLDKETGETSEEEVTISKDEGNRPSTTLEGLSQLQPVLGPDRT
ncbi:MAG: acetyl-CoA C-acyltransferase, partial [Sphingomonadales bacterium]|nr:acetyl-CoA C-acyltransferase [Sphingomonadales bacterium]